MARECGRRYALVEARRPAPPTAFDLAIAATANVHGVPLLTYNTEDFQILAEEVDVRTPCRQYAATLWPDGDDPPEGAA